MPMPTPTFSSHVHDAVDALCSTVTAAIATKTSDDTWTTSERRLDMYMALTAALAAFLADFHKIEKLTAEFIGDAGWPE